MPSPSKIIVSACLTGRHCRYDGGACETPLIRAWLAANRADGVEVIAVCPEELGGLSTPRPPAEFRGGDSSLIWEGGSSIVRKDNDADVTKAFMTGAELALGQADGAQIALLKEKSPSCGVRKVWLDGKLVAGRGVFAQRLQQEDVQLISEEDLSPETVNVRSRVESKE